MDAAHARVLADARAQPISQDGPQTLPPVDGSVRAWKFRDPDGHPLELLWFPPGGGRAVWRGHPPGAVFLGIDQRPGGQQRRKEPAVLPPAGLQDCHPVPQRWFSRTLRGGERPPETNKALRSRRNFGLADFGQCVMPRRQDNWSISQQDQFVSVSVRRIRSTQSAEEPQRWSRAIPPGRAARRAAARVQSAPGLRRWTWPGTAGL